MSEYQAVFFDMDGVTVQTASAWREIEENKILPAATGSGTPPNNTIRALSVDDAYDRLVSMDIELTVDRASFGALYDEHAEEVYRDRGTLLNGYRELLAALDDHALGLVSASRRAWVEMVLDRFDLQFDVVVSADEVEASKPAPDSYLRATTALGVEPSDGIAVEDSPHGIAAAKNAGMHCLALRGDGNTDLDLSAADTVVDGPTQLQNELRQLTAATDG